MGHVNLLRSSFLAGVLACVALDSSAFAQKANHWRVYKMADGLPEPGCTSVTLGPRGRLHMVHPVRPFVSELDGYRVRTVPLLEPARRVWESPSGQLWSVSRQGLYEYRRGAWTLHQVPEIAALFRTNAGAMNSVLLCPVRHGQVIFLLPDALMEFRSEATPQVQRLRSAAEGNLERFTGMVVTRDGALWLTGSGGLVRSSAPARSMMPGTQWRDVVPPAELQLHEFRGLWEYDDGSITVLAESGVSQEAVLARFDGRQWTSTPLHQRVQAAWRGPDGTYWAMTPTRLLQWSDGEPPRETEEVAARLYHDVAVDSAGGFWLATSDGLYHYTSLGWRQPKALAGVTGSILGLTGDTSERLWFISGNLLHSYQGERHVEYPLASNVFTPSQPIGPLHSLRTGLLALESGNRLFGYDVGRQTFVPISPPNVSGPTRILGWLSEGTICVQESQSLTNGSGRLHLFDGERWTSIPAPLGELSANGDLLTAFSAQNGDLWVGAHNGTAVYRNQQWRLFVSTDLQSPEEVICFTELPDGRIWCASQERLLEFSGENWVEIRGGFDRINRLLRSRDGSIWVATNSGLIRHYLGAWVAHGFENGLPALAVRELFEDQRGRIWAGTTQGLCTFHPEADPDPPETEIEQVNDDRNIQDGGTLNVSLSGLDRWKHTTSDQLLFSHRMDEREWSEFSDVNHVSLTDLPAGKHFFQARAMDQNCNIDPTPARLEFTVVLPWFRETRLVVIGALGGVVALFFAALALNRHRRLVRSYAEVERKVAERTRELERAHWELLHSQKMTALGTLAAGIAHDFNNILSIIKGSAQIIEENPENLPKVRTRLDRIITVVDQGAGIVQAMLGFSRDSGGQRGLCDMNTIVRDTVKLLGDRFLLEVQIAFEPTPGLPPILASRDLVQQILLNLIFNAAESAPGRREIVVSTDAAQHLPSSMVLAPEHAESYVSVAVQDFGCGISPESLPRIFEPFFTTKAFSTRRGTGLGLSMVYELAKRLQAGIAVQSTLGEGSTFTLFLPVSPAPEGSASAASPSHLPTSVPDNPPPHEQTTNPDH